jgi:hypothetical protein
VQPSILASAAHGPTPSTVDSGGAAMSEPLPHDLPALITRYRWRARLGTVLAIAVIAATLGTAWYYFVRAPGPRSVCDHLARLRRSFPADAPAIDEAVALRAVSEPSQPVDAGSDQACVWFFATEQRTRGFFDYGRLARCVTFAKTPRELYPCVY